MKPEDLLGIAIPVTYLMLLAVEAKTAARDYAPVPRWRRTGALFFVMVLLVGSAVPLLMPLNWLQHHRVFDLSAWGLLGVPVGLLCATFFAYWLHRAEHRFDWLWRASHQLHHSARRVDTAGAFYSHPVEVLLKVTLTTTVSVFVLGLTPLATAVVGLAGALLSVFQHWNTRTPHWLGYIIPRPESHLLHHAGDVAAAQVHNFGDLPVWDMLFDTFENPWEAWTGSVGFDAPASARIKDMLLMRDVNSEV